MTSIEINNSIGALVDHLSRLHVTRTSAEISDILDRQGGVSYYEDGAMDEYVSSKDNRLAKILAAASAAADCLGVQPLKDGSAYGIAAVADESASRIRMAHAVVTGEVDIEEAAEHLVDRAASRMVTFTNHCIQTVESFSKDAITAAISVYCPQMRPVIPVLHNAVSRCSHSVCHAVHTGVHAVARAARPVVSTIARGASTIVKSVYNFFRR